MKKIFAVSLISLTILLMAGPMAAQAAVDPAWQASFATAVQASGLQQAIAAQLAAGVSVEQIMAALFAMGDINPGAAINAAIIAGADADAVTAAANAAGISPAIISAAVNAGKQGLGYTPPPGLQGPKINVGSALPPSTGTISQSAP